MAAAVTAAGVEPNIKIVDADTKTAVAAAEQLGCEVGAIANSVVFDCDGEPLLVMASGAHRVDTELLARALGATAINKAAPQFVRSATDQVIGGVADRASDAVAHGRRQHLGHVSDHLDGGGHRGFGDGDDVRTAVGDHGWRRNAGSLSVEVDVLHGATRSGGHGFPGVLTG